MSDPTPDLPSWFYGILIAAIGSLSAGLVKMFYMIRGDSSERIESLKREVVEQRTEIDELRDEAKLCQEDRIEIWKALARLNGGTVPAAEARLPSPE